MEFTVKSYSYLVNSLKNKYKSFYSLFQFLTYKKIINVNNLVILRHDVDRKPENSSEMAKIENALGIRGTYYFRIVRESFDVDIIKKIADLGHEIGYHYEDVDLTIKNYKLKTKNEEDRERLIDLAYESFCENLEEMRKVADIKTICMHGSPRSKYDNKIIWEKYNYKDLGIIGEPYFDIDFNEFAYFTDTGRRWNGHKFSVRDKVNSKYNFDFKTTQQIIDNIDKLPPKIMFTIHPERWTNSLFP